MREVLLKSRVLITVVDWAEVVAEIALLFAWKAAGMAGAGRVLVAWVVFSGLLGLACMCAPAGRLPPPACGRVFLNFAGAVFGAALIWFDHGLLGLMALVGLFGSEVYRHRCDALAGRVCRHR